MIYQARPSEQNHGRLLRQSLPALLIACYLLALALPGPGQWLNAWQFPASVPEVLNPRLPQSLVAALLFLASLGTQLKRLPLVLRQPGLLVLALSAVWLVPAALVVPLRWLLPLVVDPQQAAALAIGFALVAAMPVANSSAAWTQQSRGELPWTLVLVVGSIIACPVVTPLVLWLLGLTFSEVEGERLSQLMSHFTGLKFIIWVLIPTALGILARQWVGPERVARFRDPVLISSVLLLLMLNYINASVAFPSMKSQISFPGLAVIAVMALLTCLAGLAAARWIGFATRSSRQVVVALDYGLMMKNTGLALALANEVLKTQPLVVLPLFAATLVQHLMASWHHARLHQKGWPATSPEAT